MHHLRPYHMELPKDVYWWCSIHQRQATHIEVTSGHIVCHISGITAPCDCVDLTGKPEEIAKLEQ